MWGKLSWAAIPFDQPIPLIASVVVIVVIFGVLRLGGRERMGSLSLARMDHQRRP